MASIKAYNKKSFIFICLNLNPTLCFCILDDFL